MIFVRMVAGLFLFTFGASLAVAQSSTSILQYDKNGNVIGSTEKQTESPAPAVAPQSPGQPAAGDNASAPAFADTDAEAHEPREVLIVDPPSGFLRAMVRDGYALIERIRLDALDMTVLRLRTPADVTVDQALASIRAQYPSVVSGANQRLSPGSGQKGDYGRKLFGWGEVSRDCGAGLRIGIIDTIVDLEHPALRGRNIARRSFLAAQDKPGVSDHGTGVAAILIGNGNDGQWNGLLPGASLYAANIFSATPDGKLKASLGSMMKALDWQVAKNVPVVNISLTGSENRVLSLLMERASAKGLVIVAAAGNGGASAKPAYPAAHPNVLAVTAIDQQLAAYDHANQGDYIDFAAPGVGLWTAMNGGGALQSGTSFAAPFITAAVTLEIASGARPDPVALRAALRKLTQDLGPPGRDPVFGWGLVRMRPNCK
ncbi:MAG: S8 family serine peptidase [Alphaproteobacteria bacterium]